MLKQHINPAETPAKKKKRYITGAIVTILYILFIIWAGPWWLLGLPLVIDLYFSKYIHWSWYRSHPNKTVRVTCSWIGDILFAVIGVALISMFFFQNFAIPSSSLEKTMLIGDKLFVSKLAYGPRMPITPIHVPLTHNTLPISGGKSYMDHPQWKYRRLKGFGHVQREDLVVFNFPAGDTVALKKTNPDYYTLCKIYGRDVVWSDKIQFGNVVYRPVDRRDHFVKRCVGMPGDNLQIINNQLYINGKPEHNPSRMQLNYWVQTDGTPLNQELLDDLGINYRDVAVMQSDATQQFIKGTGFKALADGQFGLIYHLPLTTKMLETIKREPYVKAISVEQDNSTDLIYPLTINTGWTRDNYGPVWIPRKGMKVKLNENALALYSRCIKNYEGHDLKVNTDGTVLIDGKPADTYTFGQDYYFMMGDNRHMSADSRYWGFVPEDHIVGKPAFIWLSTNDEKGLFNGKIRWSRMMRPVKDK